MPFLIDCFSPSEMLHMVSLANRHQVLNTDQKRFLIGLRMAEIGLDGSYKVHPDKIGKFNRIFGQFLNELAPGERCDKAECLTCDRLQTLLEDFHGKQESIEFQRFMEWFQKSTLLYNPDEGSQAENATTDDEAEPEAGFTQLDPAATSPMAGLDSAKLPHTPSPTPPSSPRLPEPAAMPVPPRDPEPLEAVLVAPPPVTPAPVPEALFSLNTSHPLIHRLSALLERDTAMLSVTDRGPGISAQHLPRLTERFYRVDKARSRELGGTGLGLSIVKHLAHAMQGSVRAASEVGKGTTFTVTLPRSGGAGYTPQGT